jgi:hypothetical protein
MVTQPDGPPPRRLHPVTTSDAEPPFDADYDTPPTTSNSRAIADRAAEQAVLTALLHQPDLGEHLATQLEPDDFFWPIHHQLWTSWHQLAQTDGVPPDPVTLNAHLLRTKQHDAARTLADLTTNPASPVLAAKYAQIVRDTARLRTVDQLATGLRQIAATGRVDDIDHYLAEALQRLDDTVMRFGPRTPSSASGFRDLSWILTGQAPEIPPPVWVQHDAGHAVFYAGKVNGVFGDPETAKTWLAQCAIVEALNNGGTAAMVDVDHNGENHTAARLLLHGAPIQALAHPDRFRYYDPQEADELRAAINDITTRRPDIVLIDSLGEVFPMLGISTNDGDEITGGLRLISKPADTGSCVIFIDHLPKGVDARASGFAIGSIAKKRAIRGAYIRAEDRTKPAPGQVGRISLFIEKDTAGELRKVTPGGKYLGTFVLDSTQPHITKWSIHRDDLATDTDGTLRPTHLMEKVSRHIEQNDQCSFRDIKESITAKDKWLRLAIKHLVEEGFVATMAGPRNSTRHHTIALYREAEDDQI